MKREDRRRWVKWGAISGLETHVMSDSCRGFHSCQSPKVSSSNTTSYNLSYSSKNPQWLTVFCIRSKGFGVIFWASVFSYQLNLLLLFAAPHVGDSFLPLCLHKLLLAPWWTPSSMSEHIIPGPVCTWLQGHFWVSLCSCTSFCTLMSALYFVKVTF